MRCSKFCSLFRRLKSRSKLFIDSLPVDMLNSSSCRSVCFNMRAARFGSNFVVNCFCDSQTLILFVSKSTQVTSFGGSYRSKNRESTPIRYGNGACSTSAKPSGHSGMYGHCHLKGKSSVTTASATAVRVAGRNE